MSSKVKYDYNKLYKEYENLINIQNELKDKNLSELNAKNKIIKKLERKSINFDET